MRDLGLQERPRYNANARYNDFVKDRQKLSLGQTLSSFNGEGKGRAGSKTSKQLFIMTNI